MTDENQAAPPSLAILADRLNILVRTRLWAQILAAMIFGVATGGEAASVILSIGDPTVNRYLSYASMIIPSNDAFIGNGDPLAHAIFDGSGQFVGADFLVLGSDVSDSGTEVNSEIDVAFLAGPNGQTGPNQGADENGVVGTHPGFNGSVGNAGGTPMNILGGTTLSGATIDTILGDFTRNSGADPIAHDADGAGEGGLGDVGD